MDRDDAILKLERCYRNPATMHPIQGQGEDKIDLPVPMLVRFDPPLHWWCRCTVVRKKNEAK